jgi:Thioredoxin
MLKTLALAVAAAGLGRFSSVHALPRPQLMCSQTVKSSCRASAATTPRPNNNARPFATTTDATSSTLEQTMLQAAAAIGVLRGGAVLEHATLADVEATLLRAGSENKLVVIDFSAVWCGPCKMIAPLVRMTKQKHGLYKALCGVHDALCRPELTHFCSFASFGRRRTIFFWNSLKSSPSLSVRLCLSRWTWTKIPIVSCFKDRCAHSLRTSLTLVSSPSRGQVQCLGHAHICVYQGGRSCGSPHGRQSRAPSRTHS